MCTEPWSGSHSVTDESSLLLFYDEHQACGINQVVKSLEDVSSVFTIRASCLPPELYSHTSVRKGWAKSAAK